MELEPVGRVAEPDKLDMEPIVVPIVGYSIDREEVIEKFRFRPVQPAGAALDVLRATDAHGNAPLGPVMRYLERCLLSDEQERWREFLDRDDVFIEQTVLVDLYQRITEAYAERPTLPSSVSANGGSTTKPTPPGGARARASTSKRSRSS